MTGDGERVYNIRRRTGADAKPNTPWAGEIDLITQANAQDLSHMVQSDA